MALTEILAFAAQYCVQIISSLGYPGLFLLMAFESMIIPIPSELVMPFAGFLIAEGRFSVVGVFLASSLGSLSGSLLSYYIGRYGGNRLVLRYGRYLLLDEQDLVRTEKWFAQKGEKTILIGRFIPVVRHLISLPAGMGKMKLSHFCFYTFLGAAIWNMLLAYAGYFSGKNWAAIRHYSEPISVIVVILLVVAGFWFFYRHWQHKKKSTY